MPWQTRAGHAAAELSHSRIFTYFALRRALPVRELLLPCRCACRLPFHDPEQKHMANRETPESGPTMPAFSKIGYAFKSPRSASAAFKSTLPKPSVNQA